MVVKSPVPLKRERVGQELCCLTDANIGETIDFVYNKDGRTEVRTVLVVKKNSDGIEGLDEQRNGEWRHFLNSKASTVDIVEPFAEENVSPSNEVFVRFDEAMERLGQSLSGELLAELYLKHVALEGKSAAYDANRGVVVVTLPVVENRISAVRRDSDVSYKNKRGEVLTQYIYAGGKIGVFCQSTGVSNEDVSPDEFARILTEFLAS